MNKYVIMVYKKNNGSKDFVYIYLITGQKEAKFLRQFYINQG